MYKRGEFVVFDGAGEVLEVYDDAYNEGAGRSVKAVRVKVRLSEEPGHNFIVQVPIVCVQLASDVDKRAKVGA